MIPVIFINCKEYPFVDDFLNSRKVLETRNRNTLGRFLGEKILIAETGKGKPVIRFMCKITMVRCYLDKWPYERDRNLHNIAPGSRYDWKPETKKKWAYSFSDIVPVSVPFPVNGKRHGRTWIEYNEKEVSEN